MHGIEKRIVYIVRSDVDPSVRDKALWTRE